MAGQPKRRDGHEWTKGVNGRMFHDDEILADDFDIELILAPIRRPLKVPVLEQPLPRRADGR